MSLFVSTEGKWRDPCSTFINQSSWRVILPRPMIRCESPRMADPDTTPELIPARACPPTGDRLHRHLDLLSVLLRQPGTARSEGEPTRVRPSVGLHPVSPLAGFPIHSVLRHRRPCGSPRPAAHPKAAAERARRKSGTRLCSMRRYQPPMPNGRLLPPAPPAQPAHCCSRFDRRWRRLGRRADGRRASTTPVAVGALSLLQLDEAAFRGTGTTVRVLSSASPERQPARTTSGDAGTGSYWRRRPDKGTAVRRQ